MKIEGLSKSFKIGYDNRSTVGTLIANEINKQISAKEKEYLESAEYLQKKADVETEVDAIKLEFSNARESIKTALVGDGIANTLRKRFLKITRDEEENAIYRANRKLTMETDRKFRLVSRYETEQLFDLETEFTSWEEAVDKGIKFYEKYGRSE